jgi:hypothetical protein
MAPSKHASIDTVPGRLGGFQEMYSNCLLSRSRFPQKLRAEIGDRSVPPFGIDVVLKKVAAIITIGIPKAPAEAASCKD